MKLSRSWSLIGGCFLASTVIMTVVNPKIRENQAKSLREKFAAGEGAISIELPRATSKEPIIRQLVWRNGKKNGDGYIEIKDSRDPGGIGKMPCDREILKESIGRLRDKLLKYDSMPLDQRKIVMPSFSIAVAGQVVCGYEGFDQLNSPKNYGINFLPLQMPMSKAP